MPRTSPRPRIGMTDDDAVERFAEEYGVTAEQIAKEQRGPRSFSSVQTFATMRSALLLIAQAHQRCRNRGDGRHCDTCFGLQVGLAAIVAEERAVAEEGRLRCMSTAHAGERCGPHCLGVAQGPADA